mgnify:CR=1 FL=1
MSNRLIDLIGINKSFDNTMVLDDLNLYIRENEFLTLLGPSGCGKTTTLRIIGGFETPDSGKVLFSGEDITSLPPNKRQLNTVFQKYALFPHMNIAENIAFGLKIKNKSKSYIDDKIKYALKLVNLDGYEKRMPNQLSGGQQQRIAIARIFLKNPPILILDEATSALDSVTEAKIQHAFDKLAAGRTTLVIAHRLSTIRNANRIISISDGVITECGTHDELLRKGGIYAELYKTQNALALETLGQ